MDHQCWGLFPPQPKSPKTGASGWSPSLPGVLRPVTISSAATVPRGPLGSSRSSHGGGHRLGRVGHGAAPPDRGLTGPWAIPTPATPPAEQTIHSSNHSRAGRRAGGDSSPRHPEAQSPQSLDPPGLVGRAPLASSQPSPPRQPPPCLHLRISWPGGWPGRA